MSEVHMLIGGWTQTQSYTVTNIGSAIDPLYPLSKINDGIAETTNGTSMVYVPTGGTAFDVYFDLGSAATVTGIRIAPQGTSASFIYHTPTNLTIYSSSDASNWTQCANFSSISATMPDWNPGTYRPFTW